MTVATAIESAQHPARIVVGDRVFVLEVDRIHVLGSGDNAAVRLVHDSIAPAHATVCFHRGRFVVEPVGDAPVFRTDGARLDRESTLDSGAKLRLGVVEIELQRDVDRATTGMVVRAGPHAPTFNELMAHELRRAPWFALSTLLHAIAFLLIWLLSPIDESKREAVVQFGLAETSDADLGEFANQPEPKFDSEPPPAPQIEASPVLEPDTQPDPVETFDDPFAALPALSDSDSLFRRITSTGGPGDILGKEAGDRFSSGFRKTVAGLRASGLEIVFAFDSTGSMGPVLKATKERMARMVRALHALVPDARIGVVTYRDRGDREQYLTRSVPLDRDLYRSLSFLQTVDADGGGDRPEAVLEAMQAAVHQPWAPRSRRVVVLIGDAPAHRETESELDRVVRRFAQDGAGCVHAIITAGDLLGRPERDVQRSFERIAHSGHGSCVSSEREDTILKQVLSLAVGAEYRDNIERLFELVEEREGKITTRALDIARRLDPDEIRREFSRSVVDDDIVDALVRSGRRQTADLLVQLLSKGSLPSQGMNAAGWALQSMLGIDKPLVDPEKPERIDLKTAKRLGEMALLLRQ